MAIIDKKLQELEEKKRVLLLERAREQQQRVASWKRIRKSTLKLKEDLIVKIENNGRTSMNSAVLGKAEVILHRIEAKQLQNSVELQSRETKKPKSKLRSKITEKSKSERITLNLKKSYGNKKKTKYKGKPDLNFVVDTPPPFSRYQTNSLRHNLKQSNLSTYFSSDNYCSSVPAPKTYKASRIPTLSPSPTQGTCSNTHKATRTPRLSLSSSSIPTLPNNTSQASFRLSSSASDIPLPHRNNNPNTKQATKKVKGGIGSDFVCNEEDKENIENNSTRKTGKKDKKKGKKKGSETKGSRTRGELVDRSVEFSPSSKTYIDRSALEFHRKKQNEERARRWLNRNKDSDPSKITYLSLSKHEHKILEKRKKELLEKVQCQQNQDSNKKKEFKLKASLLPHKLACKSTHKLHDSTDHSEDESLDDLELSLDLSETSYSMTSEWGSSELDDDSDSDDLSDSYFSTSSKPVPSWAKDEKFVRDSCREQMAWCTDPFKFFDSHGIDLDLD
eukprot:CAMPEP_0174267774 /NCGR_PEP_ID=MMETSP0439-20130205/34902_1 /TAXON_ID=0 /ORGANISM="Stereomyxa ramosa, Strain Chinc5" /LENGTH=503 /DNA_ID=CAMNT_0015355483 /DNA_START=13 /DNA_END=1521 /DNA_ORIENTATION=-